MNSTLIQHVRGGPLLTKLGDNFQARKIMYQQPDIRQQDTSKLMLYSTHDTKLAALMHTLGVWNTQQPLLPFGTTLMFELHSTSQSLNLNEHGKRSETL